MKRTFLKLIGLSLVAALAAACGGGTEDGDDRSPGSIMALADRSGEISALAEAARRAGLDDELSAPNSGLTVLAPSNDAFSVLAGQLGFRSIEELFNALTADQLRQILSYHVLPTTQTQAQLRASSSQTTLLDQGGGAIALSISIVNNDVRLTDAITRFALVNLFDVPNDNGTLHVIDRVLMPQGILTVLQTVRTNPERFLTLSTLVFEPALVETLNGAGPITLFAPTDDAFLAWASSLNGLAPNQLDTVLKYHAVGASVPSSAITFGAPVTTLSGQTFTINAGSGGAIALIDDTSATNARITAVDIVASNGVVHVVDKVLIPTLSGN